MSIVFQTDQIAASDRLAYWHRMISQHHIAITGCPDTSRAVPLDADFNGWSRVSDWGGLQILQTRTTPVVYHHGTRQIREADRHDFFCVLILSGAGEFEYNGNSMSFHEGDLIFYDTELMYTLRYPRSVDTITLRVPRPQVLARLQEADRQFAVRIDGTHPLGKLAANLIQSLTSMSDLPPDQRCRAAEAPIIDVLCLAVKDSETRQMRPTPGQAQLLSRIKKDLGTLLEETELTLEGIASRHGISQRTLNRLFASEGTTVMKWLWSQRLSASYRAMSDGSVRQVTEAAFRFGFKDASHFTRAFKREYGIAPSKVLRP